MSLTFVELKAQYAERRREFAATRLQYQNVALGNVQLQAILSLIRFADEAGILACDACLSAEERYALGLFYANRTEMLGLDPLKTFTHAAPTPRSTPDVR